MEVQKINHSIKGLTIDSEQLDQLLNTHPYFQLGLMEKSRRYRDENHIDSLNFARKCAILFPDRSLLYSHLHANRNEENVITEEIGGNFDESLQIKNSDSDVQDENSEEIEAKKTYSALEQEYLKELIDQSIQLDASNFIIEDIEAKSKDDTSDFTKKRETKVLSFSEWIGGEQSSSTSLQSDIIDQFIQESPQIGKASSTTFYSPIEKGKKSISEDSLLFSETLASIFVQQGNIELAIKAYRNLMLKNPQKSIYFADLIKKLEENN